jgi:phosphohistidine phosphatase
MKTLTLLRHAKSTWDDPVARDFDRPLNSRGRRAAQTVGREMRALGLRFDLAIASPAVRVRETLEEVSRGYGETLEPSFDQRIYLAPPGTLLELAQAITDDVTRLLIVGHNPGLEGLALRLSRAEGQMYAELSEKYPTATLAEISLPAERWSEVTEGSGTLQRFMRPRDLDPELGPDEDSY